MADTMSLSDAFGKVKVTTGQAIALLTDLAAGHTDRDPELSAALNKAITEISGGPKEEPKEEEHSVATGTTRSR